MDGIVKIDSSDNLIATSNVGALSPSFVSDIKTMIAQSRRQAYAAVNQLMVETYWNIGKRIVEEEQSGHLRAAYGKRLLKQLSEALTMEFGRGWSANQLYYFRQFYVTFDGKFPTACGILTWSHYKRLLSVPNQEVREWYFFLYNRDMIVIMRMYK